MKREEKIKEAAIGRYGNNGRESQYMLAKILAFIVGARYADANPRNVYIVIRQEEHSDYAEKVFVDKKKAEAYCKSLNDNPKEYSRVIEEMEVTL